MSVAPSPRSPAAPSQTPLPVTSYIELLTNYIATVERENQSALAARSQPPIGAFSQPRLGARRQR